MTDERDLLLPRVVSNEVNLSRSVVLALLRPAEVPVSFVRSGVQFYVFATICTAPIVSQLDVVALVC